MDRNSYSSESADSSSGVDEIDGGVSSCIGRRRGSTGIENMFEKDLNLLKSDKYAEYYSMNYKYKGYLLIFAHSTFTVADFEDREMLKDIEMLKGSFSRLGFKIVVHKDLRLQELEDVIYNATRMNFEKYASLAIAVSSHGDVKNGGILAKDRAYDPNEVLFDPFKNVDTLYGKPKMFFIEYCRGKKMDKGVTLLSNAVATGPVETDGAVLEEFKIPREADMLIVYATMEGYIAFNNDVNGSQFFIYLTDALNQLAATRDLQTVLTIANQRLSIDFSSKNYKYPELDKKKQCMCIMHTLTRLIFFGSQSY